MAASVSARSTTADTGLAALPARPPTPPREAPSNVAPVVASVKPGLHRTLSQTHRKALQTPPSVTLVSPATTESSAGPVRKRVEWSGRTEYKEAPHFRDGERPTKSSPLPGASSTRSKPVKGILKPSSSPCQPATPSALNARLDAAGGPINLPEMLDSTIKQLVGADRDSKVDAYTTLARALKASNNLPDRVALQGKMSLLTQFIQRDITLKPVDRSLANHALSLLTTFLHFNAIASTIPHDFAVFIVDHAIRTFEDPALTKDNVRHLMQVIAFQSFSPKVMSQDRVGRLLTAVHNIEDHLTGKSIVMSRIQLYKRLVKQCPMHLVSHASWLQDMFTDTLSLTKDIRNEAIGLGMEAGFALRHERQVQRNAMDILQTTPEDKSFIQSYIESLMSMLKDKEKDRQRAATVPQLWAVVNLFLRCPPEKWDLYGPWLTVVQTAFNMPDLTVKLEANTAWNRYVYLSLSDSKLSPKSLSTLCQPLLSQLRKKVSPKHVEEAPRLRRAVIGGACNLFYYAFRPGADKHSPDMIWDVAVQPIILQIISLADNTAVAGDWIDEAAKVLNGLLDGSTHRVWRDSRVQELSLIKGDELPPIDAKWIRRNSDRVFKLVEPILKARITSLANPASSTFKLWHSHVGAVAAASAKDIKVSEDTVKFFASAFGTLYRTWCTGIPFEDASQPDEVAIKAHLEGIRAMLQVMVNGLGVLPFTEKKLSMTTPDLFEPITTPSTRVDGKTRGIVRTPLLHLLNLFCTVPTGIPDDQILSNFFIAVFDPFFAGKSEKVRLEQTREMLRSLPRSATCPAGIWQLACQNLRMPFERTISVTDKAEKILGPEYREMISFLERGINCHPNLSTDTWLQLVNLIDEHVLNHFGQAGRAQVLIEPLAKMLSDIPTTTTTPALEQLKLITTTTILERTKYPRDKQVMDIARRHLWGAAPAPSHHEAFRPFDHLFKLTKSVLMTTYISFDPVAASSLLSAVTTFLRDSPAQASEEQLCALADGLTLWIADEAGRLASGEQSSIIPAVENLWSQICAKMVTLGKTDSPSFAKLEPLLTAGLSSKHPTLVRAAVDTWNVVAKDEEPEISDSLRSILSSVSSKLDQENALAERVSTGSGAQPVSVNRNSRSPLKASLLSSPAVSQGLLSTQTPSPAATALSTRSKRKRKVEEATPTETRTRTSKRTSTPRLRHDNSQIQFKAVASSSPDLGETQHLTERQKEVRERQEAEANLYTTLVPSSPVPLKTAASGPVPQLEQTTPQQGASYEELISSTPTPRRGQLMAIDDFNDPPSSPPELRPNPFLSEIQSRSRTSSSLEMEKWDFSSPPNTPTINSQRAIIEQVQQNENEAAVEPDLPAPKRRSPRADRLRSGAHAGDKETKEVGPAPVDVPEPPAEVPEPKKRRDKKRSKAQKAAEKASEKAAATSMRATRSSRSRSQAQDAKEDLATEEQSTSFALSEGDESRMVNLVVELESRRAPSPVQEDRSPSPPRSRKTRRSLINNDDGCITVQSDEMSSPVPSSKHHAGADSPRLPSLEPETATETDRDSKGKRKRGGSKLGGSRKKKRKSSRNSEDVTETKEASAAVDAAAAPEVGVQTRRSSRMSQQQSEHTEEEMSSPIELETKDVTSTAAEGAPDEDIDNQNDTDDELLSQLLADSTAVSQSQSLIVDAQEESQMPTTAMADTSMSLVEEDGIEGEPRQEEEPEAAPTAAEPDAGACALDTLRSGVELLRKAKLSREQVGEMETLIMDLKREMYQAEYRGR